MQTVDSSALLDSVIEGLHSCAQRLGIEAYCQNIRDLVEWRLRGSTHVVFCGEFNRGKSSIINTLLDISICPTNALPETAVPAIIEYGPKLTARVEYVNRPPVSIEPTIAALEQFSAMSGTVLDQVHHIHFTVPAKLLQSGLVLVDTPGVNDLSRQRTDITYGFLPLADAAVIVLDAAAPVTRSESTFLTSTVLPTAFERLLFVLGKADRLDDEELDESLEGARQRLQLIPGVGRVDPLPVATSGRGIPEFREKLLAINKESLKNREAQTRRRLALLIDDILHEAESRAIEDKLKPEQRIKFRFEIQKSTSEIALRHSQVSKYIDRFGRETLQTLVNQSLTACHRQLRSELLHSLDLLESRIGDFTRKQVPYRVSQCLQQWAAVKGPELHAFLTRFTDRVSRDYAAAFSAPLESVRMRAAVDFPEVSVRPAAEETNRVREMIVQHLLPASIPMAAGYLLFGPFGLIGGSILGRVAEARLNEKRLAEQKTEAAAWINQFLEETFRNFSSGLSASLSAWFDELSRLLESDAVMRIKMIEGRSTTGNGNADLLEVCDRLRGLKRLLEEGSNE